MKLFLTSAGLPPETTEAFLKLLGKKPEETKVCFISTASFEKYPKGDAEYVKKDKQRLSEIGFKTITEIDLRKENEDSLSAKLSDSHVIFVEGGNTFYLLKYVRASGFDKVIRPFLDRGGIYVGVSAGSYIAGLDILPTQWKHASDQNAVGLKDLRGLGLVDFAFFCHYKPEYESVINGNKHKIPYSVIALTDSQAVLVDGEMTQFVGPGEFKQFK
ncbi:MAG: Type 1 glutamine amidotransferase-like domain-containing protein [bacterium]|nr:Type 1 glutamine amidotransferase-like domain-containing protein [bacterium]